jgi:3'-phosphoadenosine 5'-phosphosulfate (PAPS) 3'-phosphatase
MDFAEFERRFILLKPVIRETGQYIRDMRKRGVPEVISKADGSPVTLFDIKANEMLCSFLTNNFPGEVVIGEESGNKAYESGLDNVWYVDPIDGTKAYIEGLDGYYVLIGFCWKGVPVLGLIYQPEKDILLYGWPGKMVSSFPVHSGDGNLINNKPRWDGQRSIVMKSVPAEDRKYLETRFGISRAKYRSDMIDMMSALYGYSNGFISYRPTAYWDLCAPAALLRSNGYHLASEDAEHPVLFNDGNVMSGFYYCLPSDTPREFIRVVRSRQIT